MCLVYPGNRTGHVMPRAGAQLHLERNLIRTKTQMQRHYSIKEFNDLMEAGLGLEVSLYFSSPEMMRMESCCDVICFSIVTPR